MSSELHEAAEIFTAKGQYKAMNTSDGEHADSLDGATSLPNQGQDPPEQEQFMNKMETKYFFAIAEALMT